MLEITDLFADITIPHVDSLVYSNKVTSGDSSKKSPISLKQIALILFIVILINLAVIKRMLGQPINLISQRPIKLLIVHLSSICILVSVTAAFGTGEIANFPDNGLMCSSVSYWKSVYLSQFSLNVAAIVYDRTYIFRRRRRRLPGNGRIPTMKIISMIWLISLIFSLPTAIMTKSQTGISPKTTGNSKDDNMQLSLHCKPVTLVNSELATVLYEFLRLLMFHSGIAIYMVYVVLKIQPSISVLLQTALRYPQERTLRRIRSVRLIYFHLVSFIFIWLPYGLYMFPQSVLSRAGIIIVSKHTNNLLPEFNMNGFFSLTLCLYIVLNPMISALLIEYNIPTCRNTPIANSENSQRLQQQQEQFPQIVAVPPCEQQEGNENDNNEAYSTSQETTQSVRDNPSDQGVARYSGNTIQFPFVVEDDDDENVSKGATTAGDNKKDKNCQQKGNGNDCLETKVGKATATMKQRDNPFDVTKETLV